LSHLTVSVSWMGGNWSGCCVGDMAVMVIRIVEVPGGVTRGGGVVLTAALLPQPLE